MVARLHQNFRLMKEQEKMSPRLSLYPPSEQLQQAQRTTAKLMSKKALVSHLHHI